jgi:hypothetical protein
MAHSIGLGYGRAVNRRSRVAVVGFIMGSLSGPCTFVFLLISNTVRNRFYQEKIADAIELCAVWVPGSAALLVCGVAIVTIRRSKHQALRGIWFAVLGLLAVLAWAIVPFVFAAIAGAG